MEDGREGCARRMRVQTQGEGVTPTRAVSPEVSFPACGWGVGEQCLKWLLKLVSLQGFVSFHHGDLETRAGGGGRAQWAFSILSWAGMRTTRGAGVRGGGVPGGGACLPVSLLLLLPPLPAPQWGGERSAEAGLGSSSAESLLNTQPELWL